MKKKNIALRIASALMTACLLTTCVISGTFAKYVTEDSANDSARVAKWGVKVAVDGLDGNTINDDLGFFKTAYAKKAEANHEIATTVAADVEVVAPGTAGEGFAAMIAGQPEVAVNVAIEADLKLENWMVESTYYCPIEITVGSTTLKGTAYNNAEAFEAAVEAAIIKALITDATVIVDGSVSKSNKNYNPNESFGATDAVDLKVSWAWGFDGNDDAKDTALGDAAAAGNAATIEFSLKVTVTQLD